jgi:hypothetical protein
MNRQLEIAVLLWPLGSTALGQQPEAEDQLPSPPEGKQWKLVWKGD